MKTISYPEKKTERFIPAYTIPWMLALWILHISVYYGAMLLTSGMFHHNITTAFDLKIPLFPPAITVYYLSFPFWVINYFLIARENPEHCKRVITGVLISYLLTFTIFLIYPTTMERPAVEGTDLSSIILKIIYAADKPVNLMPSMHCMDSWLCWRGLFGCKKVPKTYKIFSLIFAVAVFASTLLVHQHVMIDVPTGILIAELGLLISGIVFRKHL